MAEPLVIRHLVRWVGPVVRQTPRMGLGDLPVHDVRPSLIEERADLLALLESLDDAAWVKSTDSALGG